MGDQITFTDLGLKDELLKAVTDLGYEIPTPIQKKSIPHLLFSDRDLVALAQTGTGKTAAFSLPMLQKIDPSSRKVQCIILSPTRELALQISRDIEAFTKYCKKIKSIAVYGGTDIRKQIRALDDGAQVVIGTPGRVIDLIKRKKLRLENVEMLVLDEADEMLSMGFKEDMDTILASTPDEKQTLLFSATMPKEIARIANTYMSDPVEIAAGEKNIGAKNVDHIYYTTSDRFRYEVLKRISDMNSNIYGIVFCRTRRDTKEVADKLIQDGYNADALHGDLSQAQRDHVMGRFRKRSLQLLIATDVAARGLDVNDLTHVINYKLPDNLESYIHRSGRTGRAGKQGISISIVTKKEMGRIRRLERNIKKKFVESKVPDNKAICEKRMYSLIDRMEKVEVNEEQIAPFMDKIHEQMSVFDRETLIKKFVSLEFNEFLAYYKDAPDLNASGDKRDRSRNIDTSSNFCRFYINLGSKSGINPRMLMDIINKKKTLKGAEIGEISIMKKFSFFEIDANLKDECIAEFQGMEYEDKHIVVEVASPPPTGSDKAKAKRNRRPDGRRSGGGGYRRDNARRGDRNDRGGRGRRGGNRRSRK